MDEQTLERQVELTQFKFDIPGLPGSGSGGDAGRNFLLAFSSAGARVAASVDSDAARNRNDTSLTSYAQLLNALWSAPSGKGDVLRENVARAYCTMRSFLRLCAPTSPLAIEAKARCQKALDAVSQYLGDEAGAIETRIDADLGVRSLTAIGVIADGGPGALHAWQILAELPDPPAELGRVDDTGEYRGISPGETSGSEPPSPTPAPKPAPETAHLYDVWFGTNRAPIDASDPGKGFANERDPAGTVHYGTCSVEIPKTHKFGSTGTHFLKRWLHLEFRDDHLKLKKISPFSSGADFLEAMREEMESLDTNERTILVYLHGFNTSFEEAALRAAQIGFDLKIPGATAFYSWPSMADVRGYPADIARVEASEKQMADFLTALANESGATRVHVIAHSMGNRGFARAIARITSHAATTGNVRFGQILLAAPDIDVDLFNQLAVAYPLISDRTTMYVSARDRALSLSSWLQDSDRAGFTPPITTLDGIDTIEVTNIDLTLLGHGYFAEAAPVLYDMKDLMEANKDPAKRLRIEEKDASGRKYWSIGA